MRELAPAAERLLPLSPRVPLPAMATAASVDAAGHVGNATPWPQPAPKVTCS